MTVAELQTDTLFLSNTVLGQYPLIAILNNLNRYYDEAVAFIWSVDNSWNFDEGIDFLPFASTNVFSGQSDYPLPSTARQIFRVSILDSNGKLNQLDALSDKEFPPEGETGIPTKYRLTGRSILLSPTPNYNRPAGVVIEMSKSVTPLLTGTDIPRIDREFHRYLSYGATKDWYFSKSNIVKKREMEREMEGMKIAIRNFYVNRHKDYQPGKIKVSLENYY